MTTLRKCKENHRAPLYFLIFSIALIASSFQVRGEERAEKKLLITYQSDSDSCTKKISLIAAVEVPAALINDNAELMASPIFLTLGDSNQLQFQVLKETSIYHYQFKFISITSPSFIKVGEQETNNPIFPLTLMRPGEATLDFSCEKIVSAHFNVDKWAWIPDQTVASARIHVPITIGNKNTGLKEESSSMPPSQIIPDEVKITSDNLTPGNRGCVNIEVFHLAEDGHEITLDPIVLRLAPSYIYNVTQAFVSVHHTIIHDSWYPPSKLSFQLNNENSINESSVIAIYDWHVWGDGPGYLIIPKQSGHQTLDFSYTKTISENNGSIWSRWTQRPITRTVTIKVYLPIEVVEYSNPGNGSE